MAWRNSSPKKKWNGAKVFGGRRIYNSLPIKKLITAESKPASLLIHCTRKNRPRKISTRVLGRRTQKFVSGLLPDRVAKPAGLNGIERNILILLGWFGRNLLLHFACSSRIDCSRKNCCSQSIRPLAAPARFCSRPIPRG